MYHEMTYREVAERRRRVIFIAVVAAVLCAALVLLTFLSFKVSRSQAVTSIQDSVMTAATQCAAVEGSYPSSLDHLELYYGLIINHDDYFVDYEWFADNIPPNVTVIVR